MHRGEKPAGRPPDQWALDSRLRIELTDVAVARFLMRELLRWGPRKLVGVADVSRGQRARDSAHGINSPNLCSPPFSGGEGDSCPIGRPDSSHVMGIEKRELRGWTAGD